MDMADHITLYRDACRKVYKVYLQLVQWTNDSNQWQGPQFIAKKQDVLS